MNYFDLYRVATRPTNPLDYSIHRYKTIETDFARLRVSLDVLQLFFYVNCQFEALSNDHKYLIFPF